jgi:ABC-type multidrug transport system permease subunit
MSVILRILLVIAGLITALFVARDALNFELIQTWVAILLVAVVVGVWSLRALRRET